MRDRNFPSEWENTAFCADHHFFVVMCNFAEFRSLRHDHNFVTITTSSDVQLRCNRELRLKNYFVRENHFVRIFMKLMESLQWFIPRQNGCHQNDLWPRYTPIRYLNSVFFGRPWPKEHPTLTICKPSTVCVLADSDSCCYVKHNEKQVLDYETSKQTVKRIPIIS